MATKKIQNWEAMVEEWFGKLPPISKNAREAIVNITPWIALIFGILGVLVSLGGFGVLSALSTIIALNSGFGYAAQSLVGAALGLVASIVLLMAYPGAKARKQKGWNLLFWSE